VQLDQGNQPVIAWRPHRGVLFYRPLPGQEMVKKRESGGINSLQADDPNKKIGGKFNLKGFGLSN